MRALRRQLWREWREQRFALAAVLVLVPLALVVLSFSFSGALVDDPLFASGAAALAVVAMLFGVGGELLGTDQKSGALRWLERLPDGLGGAFRAKLVFFVLATALAGVYGWALARGLALLGGATPDPSPEGRLAPLWAATTLLALWTFAASAWALRGGLSLLAGGLLVAAIAFPAWRLLDAGYQPAPEEWLVAFELSALGALVSAWRAFVGGRRLGGGTAGVLGRALAPVLLLVLSSGAWAAYRFAERDALAPAAGGYRVWIAEVSDDGGRALVVAELERPRWKQVSLVALHVDLATGAWQRIGEHVQSYEQRFSHEPRIPERSHWTIWSDATDAPFSLDLASGEVRQGAAARGRMRKPAGHGLFLPESRREPAVFRDPFRGRDFEAAGLGLQAPTSCVLVRQAAWLCRAGPNEPWLLLDPETGVRRAVPWSDALEPAALLVDGGILLASVPAARPGERTAVAAALAYPERDLVIDLALPDDLPAPLRDEDWALCNAYTTDYARPWQEPTAFERGQAPLFKTAHGVLRLVPERGALEPVAASPRERFLRGADQSVLLIDARERFVSLDVATGERRVLFPR